MKTQLLMILHNNRYRIMIYIDNSVSLTAGSAIATETRHLANLILHLTPNLYLLLTLLKIYKFQFKKKIIFFVFIHDSLKVAVYPFL